MREDDLSAEQSARADYQRASEFNVHSFIVKLWLEETNDDSEIWRGYITHVPGGERRYLKDLDEIPIFIAPYVGAVGTRSTKWHSIRRWLTR
jgi:hypothetical protein